MDARHLVRNRAAAKVNLRLADNDGKIGNQILNDGVSSGELLFLRMVMVEYAIS
jgi:hypothetical protein